MRTAAPLEPTLSRVRRGSARVPDEARSADSPCASSDAASMREGFAPRFTTAIPSNTTSHSVAARSCARGPMTPGDGARTAEGIW